MRCLLLMVLLAPLLSGQEVFGVEPNSGQFSEEVLFFQREDRLGLVFTRDSIRLPNHVEVQLVGLSAAAQVRLEEALPTLFHSYPEPMSKTLYRKVVVANAYPGIDAVWQRRELTLRVAAGRDVGGLRLRVSGISSGPFAEEARTVPSYLLSVKEVRQGSRVAPMAGAVVTAGGELVRILIPGLDVSLPTEVVLNVGGPSTPDIEWIAGPGVASSGEYRYRHYNSSMSFGLTGQIAYGRFATDGTPIWITLMAGREWREKEVWSISGKALAVTGQTYVRGFPVVSAVVNRQGPTPYVAMLDAETGAMRTGTRIALEGVAKIEAVTQESDGGVVVGGTELTGGAPRGFLVKWQPANQRFVYEQTMEDPVRGLALTQAENLVYATYSAASYPPRLRFGELGLAGTPVGRVLEPKLTARYSGMSESPEMTAMYIKTTPRRSLVAFFVLKDAIHQGNLGSFSLEDSATRYLQAMEGVDGLEDLEVSEDGMVRALVRQRDVARLPVTENAMLAGPCEDGRYYRRIASNGALLHAAYVGSNVRTVGASEPTKREPLLGCMASQANEGQVSAVAWGEVVVVRGGNFGPTRTVYATPDAGRMYPLTLAGYRVTIGGLDAPIFSVGRGEVSVQVPFEIRSVATFPWVVRVYGPDAPQNTFSVTWKDWWSKLFHNGELKNRWGLPFAKALNQDGTVNSEENPALVGSTVSLFGSGVILQGPGMGTGGTHPVGVVRQSGMLASGGKARVAFLGSAPGLSTGVFQLNLELPKVWAGTGTRTMPLGLSVGLTVSSLLAFYDSVAIWVK